MTWRTRAMVRLAWVAVRAPVRAWRQGQRRLDTAFLWPAIRDQAGEQGLTVEMAREAFLMHAERDRACRANRCAVSLSSLGRANRRGDFAEDEMRWRMGELT